MVGVGDAAPDFEGVTSLGGTFKLSATKGHPVVVYFFPKADTPGCTIETKAFRDIHPEFAKRNVTVVGVSVDTADDESKFANKCGIPFGLVADPDGRISTAYGVRQPGGHASRITFLIGADGKVVERVEGKPTDHVDAAKARFLTT